MGWSISGSFISRETARNIICVLHSGVSEGSGSVIREYVCDKPHVFIRSITIASFFTFGCMNLKLFHLKVS